MGETSGIAQPPALGLTRGGVEVEGHVGDGPVVPQGRELVLHQHRLARAGKAHQHDGAAPAQQHVHEVADAGRFHRVNQGSLREYIDR